MGVKYTPINMVRDKALAKEAFLKRLRQRIKEAMANNAPSMLVNSPPAALNLLGRTAKRACFNDTSKWSGAVPFLLIACSFSNCT